MWECSLQIQFPAIFLSLAFSTFLSLSLFLSPSLYIYIYIYMTKMNKYARSYYDRKFYMFSTE